MRALVTTAVSFLLGLSVFAADPAVDRALQDATKKYPPGDYPRAIDLPDATRKKPGDVPRFEIHEVAASGAHNQSYIYRKPDGTSEALFLMPEVLLTTPAIKTARPDRDSDGSPMVKIALTEAGAQKFGEVTQKLINKRIGIVLDGQLVAAPVIRSAIYGGQLIITTSGEKEAAEMARELNKE
jgi:preprotein translocase subunit SecD